MNTDSSRVRIPADVEREDRVLAGLTARQLAILTLTAVLAWSLYTALVQLVPPTIALAPAVPLMGIGAALALLRRDGLGLDQLLMAAWKQSRTPRHQVYAPEGIGSPPSWSPPGPPPPAPLWLPARAVLPGGVIDLGDDGVAAIVDCSTVSFALRTPEEQQALVAAYARWLNSLTQPMQLLIAAERINLAPTIARLRSDAPTLPHPALERAALEHARFLARLESSRDLLRRRVLLILREPSNANDTDAAASRVLRRAEDACRSLAAASVSARLLDTDQVTATLASCLDPAIPPGLTAQALPGDVITTREGLR